MSDEMVRWLGEQLDEDERIARAAVSDHEREPRLVPCDAGDKWFRRYSDYGGTEVVDVHGHIVVSTAHDKGAAVRTHIAQWDPARVLRETAAKRQVLARYEELRAASEEQGLIGDVTKEYQDFLLRLLALPYADRPGYREEWRP
ncbi:DUF6221 family protein [Streptomyces liliifuscus]|uniref:Uncharacterized protein n=1 Tax=Streptomyces liliifuscus TaxID=2797636 RepID=A0A7T7L2H3_9ACTN|nr:DUF6221 family protein [Streptomyces liliifuscus]QQM45214.1 hypothetical protein JEQ17_41285 [Streptomyces liliifuscus]